MSRSQGFNVVLVHGGFVDGAAWEDVYKALRREGYNVSIVQAPPELRAFDELGFAMRDRLPASAHSTDSLIASFAQIGLTLGNGFDWKKLDEPTKRGLLRAAKSGAQIVERT
ncbi:hypothetical protein [Povalibacter sp.]|uniref:hypothetical protein n=1 Tax=Povalibacter sp. TaxID=1962978 RepID=UPI002F41D197